MYDVRDVSDEDKDFLVEIRKQVFAYVQKIGDDAASDMLNSFYLSKSNNQSVEELTVHLIHELQSKHIKIIALTALPAGVGDSIR